MKLSRLLLALLLSAQFCLFWQFANREIVWAYANGYDQNSYLSISYVLAQDTQREGPFAAISHYLHQPQPTGFMLPLQWNVLGFFAGPGRLTALMLGFGYLVLLEIVFWLTARHVGGRTAFGWIGVGLLLAQQSAFLGNGGLFDCRIDFIVYSLYGVFVCCLVRSDGLRNRRWFAGAVASAVLLMTFRFITFSYLIGFCCTLFTLLLGWRIIRRRPTPGERLVLRQATARTVALGLSVLATGGLLITANWQAIRDYYVVGHFSGNEKSVRAAEMGIKNLAGHLTYYLDSLCREHLGALFGVLAASVLAAGAAWWAARRAGERPASAADPVRRSQWGVALCVVGASLFSPWFILTLDESKSPVVANALAPSTALLVILLAAGWRRRRLAAGLLPGPSAWVRRGLQAVAVVLVAAGLANWVSHLARQGPFSPRRASVEQIAALHETIATESARLGIRAPRIGTDLISEWNVPAAINVTVWEHLHQWLAARAAFGYAVMEHYTRERIFAEIATADVMLVSTYPKVGPYPLTADVQPVEREIAAWCEEHLLPVRTFDIEDGRVTLYMRAGVSYEGLSGEWITPAGFRVRVPAVVLDRMRSGHRQFLVLEGPVNSSWLKGLPTAVAQLTSHGDMPCPATFAEPRPDAYQLRLDLGPALSAVPAGAEVVVAVHLDGASFVPLDFGMNDSRHLVVTEPRSIRFE